MINTVFLDMDGVLVNFRKGVHNAFGKYYNYSTLSDKWTFWDDWPDVTLEMINQACRTEFWKHLEWTEDGKKIFSAVFNKFDANQIYLLTDPVIGIGTADGKMMWIKNHLLDGFIKRTIITQAPKHLLARPDTLLVDDKDENVDGFREAGGKALLVPRPWNRAHLQADRTVEVVKEFLERIV